MIGRLLKFQEKELSFKKLVINKMEFKEKFFYYSIILYILIVGLCFFIALNQNNIVFYLILLLFSIDVFLFSKKEKGLLFLLDKKTRESIIRGVNRNKKTLVKDSNFNEVLYQLKKRKVLKFLKKEKIDTHNNLPFILSSLRHRQNIELAILIVLYGGVAIILSAFFLDIIKFILPIDKLIEIKESIPSISGSELEKKSLTIKIIFVSILAFFVYSFFSFLPYLFARGYFNNKFKQTKELQTLIENIHLKRK